MQRRIGNMFEQEQGPHFWGTTINSVVKPDGRLVMGAGHALAFSRRFPDVDLAFGEKVRQHLLEGNNIFGLVQYGRLFGFQSKQHYAQPSNMTIVETGIMYLHNMMWGFKDDPVEFHLPVPGIGLGGLPIREVLDVFSAYRFDDRLHLWTLN